MKFRHFAISLCSAVCFFIPIEKVISMHVGGLVRKKYNSSVKLHKLALQGKKNLRMHMLRIATWIAEVCS